MANPWSASNWNLTEQGRILKTQGRATAEKLAKEAGTVLGAPPPRSQPLAGKTFILTKRVTQHQYYPAILEGDGPPNELSGDPKQPTTRQIVAEHSLGFEQPVDMPLEHSEEL